MDGHYSCPYRNRIELQAVARLFLSMDDYECHVVLLGCILRLMVKMRPRCRAIRSSSMGDIRMEETGRATIGRCRCGGEPKRLSKKTKHGMRWWIQCKSCKKKTRRHRPNGADIGEWNRMNRMPPSGG